MVAVVLSGLLSVAMGMFCVWATIDWLSVIERFPVMKTQWVIAVAMAWIAEAAIIGLFVVLWIQERSYRSIEKGFGDAGRNS